MIQPWIITWLITWHKNITCEYVFIQYLYENTENQHDLIDHWALKIPTFQMRKKWLQLIAKRELLACNFMDWNKLEINQLDSLMDIYAFFASSIQLKSEFISFDLFSLDTKRVSFQFFSDPAFDINRVVQREYVGWEQIIRIKNLEFIKNLLKNRKRGLIRTPYMTFRMSADNEKVPLYGSAHERLQSCKYLVSQFLRQINWGAPFWQSFGPVQSQRQSLPGTPVYDIMVISQTQIVTTSLAR